MFWGGNATRVLEIKQGQKLDEFGQFLLDMGWMHHVMCAEKMMLHKKRVFGKKKHFHVHDFDSSLTQHPRCPLGAKIHWYIPIPGYKPRTASHT